MVTTLRAVSDLTPPAADRGELPEAIRSALSARGIELDPQPDETEGVRGDRLDTAVMALFRDTHDSDVFHALYRRSGASILEWLRRLQRAERGAVDPLEVLQDTFVNVYLYSRRFRDERPESFRVWVRTIASNALRRARMRLPRQREEAFDEQVFDPPALRAEPMRRLDEAEERRRLALSWILFLEHYSRAYAALAPRDQRALALVEVDGLSYSEAGATLAVGPSNMKMIMFRARQRLLDRMDRSFARVRPASLPRNAALQAAG